MERSCLAVILAAGDSTRMKSSFSKVLHPVAGLSLLILDKGPLFITDTPAHTEPTGAELAETVTAAARHVRRFGITPKVAICSNSQFGNLDSRSGRVAREAMAILVS